MARRTIDIPQRQGDLASHRMAEGLAAAMPRLSADARRAAASVAAGVHGRRRSGQGENFWQFRPFMSGEPASKVDWRRSARDDRLYVREREWEAAQSIWLFVDRSPSMDYRSSLAPLAKQERAIVLGLAAADMLVRGGERVGLLAATPALASRRIIERLGEAMVLHRSFGTDMGSAPLGPRSEALLISDFIAPLPELEARLRAMAGRGGRGHLIVVSDPAEDTFPFAGQTEFIDPEDGFRLKVGDAGELAAGYRNRIAAHREGLRRIANSLGWSITPHCTDRPASEALMRFAMALSSGGNSAAGRA
ncbi:MAG: DUF58 domain-containing protein [Methylocystis sp.]|nr:DUF58 domain-containing protein [Methylocystis sp.]MCA3583165.1 DUF58 domain-containing protein [Methylocystis sp.]MCA3587630.1 DUF58 domain-containing protein [Methylocystis sp.]MCA3590757.1 DUF58 domain-containing protein [Methylocystis sp.]